MDAFKPVWLLFHTVIGIFGIGFLIGFHELGHFFFCKLFGIKTPSFSIGFGPTIFSKKIGGTDFKLAPIPLGGYVEIAGTAEIGQGEQKDAQSTSTDSFAIKPFWQKLLVMFGGIMFNLLFAYVTFIALFMTGLPKTPLLSPANAVPVIQAIAQPSPLKQGDRIISVNDITLDNNITPLLEIIRSKPNKNVTLVVERDGKEETVPVFVQEKKLLFSSMGTLNAIFETTAMPPASLLESIKRGIKLTNRYMQAIVASFVYLFQTKDVSNVGGPLMVISQTIKGATQGASIFFILLAIISINLAILNLIPLPILDGGQILFYTIEFIIRRPIPLKVKETIHIGSWLLILGLILYVSFFDIAKIASPYIEATKQFFGIVPK